MQRRFLAAGRLSVTCFLIAIFLFSSSITTATGRKPAEFTKGIRAQDKQDWAGSAVLMKAALQKQPEDGEIVRIYGTRFEPYLPQFYLGLAYYKLGKYEEAEKEWTASIRARAVLNTEKYEVLRQLLSECQRLLSESAPVRPRSF